MGRWGGEENLPGAPGGEARVPQTHICKHRKLLPTHTLGTAVAPHPHATHTPPTRHPPPHQPHSGRFCSQLDHCLQEASAHYKSLRFRGSVGPAQVHLVGQGAFRALRAALAPRPSSPFPPEMPRVFRHRELAQILQRRVVS